MDSFSRPLHRRKLSNANSFSAKTAYDGVFSGRRPTLAGPPAVTVDDYREIFSSGEASSSIPVLNLSDLEQASAGGLDVDGASLNEDYGRIFGGFRDLDIAVSYEELVARDTVRAPSSTSQSSQDLSDLSDQSSDALKQFNLSYNKISQRSKDGLDATTHVTQLQAVPGYTVFIDESASQPNKETVKQKSSSTNNVNLNSSKQNITEKKIATDNVNGNSSQRDVPEKQTATNNANVNSSKRDIPEKQTSQSSVGSKSGYREASLSDRNFKTSEADLKAQPSKVLSSSKSKKETNKQKPPATNNVPSSAPAESQPKEESEKQKSTVANNVLPSENGQIGVESQSRSDQDVRKFNTFQTDFKSYPSKVSSLPAASASNLDNHKDNQTRSTATNKEFPPPFFDEELNVNSAAAASTAALRKAIEKAQESIRIAKESMGRKKEGLRGFSSRSFKDSLKVKARVANVKAGEGQKEKDVKIKERDHKNGSTVAFQNLANGEKLFGAKKVVNEVHGKILEPIKNSEVELNNNKMACDSKQVDGETETEVVENDSCEDPPKGNASEPVKNSGIELNNNKMACNSKQALTETESVENDSYGDPQKDHDGEKLFGARKVVNEVHGKLSEQVKNSGIELNNNKMVGNSKQVVGETVSESVENGSCEDINERPDGFLVLESCKKEAGAAESNKLTVCQKVETKKKTTQTSDQNCYEKESFRLLENSMQENLEQEHDEKVVSAERYGEDEGQEKEDEGNESHSEEEKFYDVFEVEMIKNAQTYACSVETNDSSQKEDYEYHEAEESYENSSSDYDDAEENENVIGASNVVDDADEACKVDQNDNNVEISQNIDDVCSSHDESISSDEIEDNKDEHEAKSDNLESCGLADEDIAQNDVQFESPLDAIHGMEIEVKEYKEREETVEKEENNLQQSHDQTPEIKTELDTEIPQEPKDERREPEPSKVVDNKEERERERIKLAVERAIREARERAFAEVRQRVIADTQEKVIKASIDKTSAQAKLKAERALVERATAEARQRALEKAMKISDTRTQVNESKQTSSSHTNTESALRSKAKLEKHNRIMERAAKALAEKEKRDLLALREQAERNRLAEHLDADIKRWSTGKEGNLRALLSTLQYILGADSGWKPVSLTEIITTGAVKKAYRKATLCVHPDKLQQRGASIQQKYICEKVFDLLKAAWNRFNSEER